jgi:hypothetical protein
MAMDIEERPIMISCFHGLRYALRQLRKSPCFITTAILTLAMGANAVSAASLNDAVLPTSCGNLTSLHLKDTEITLAQYVGEGPYTDRCQ